MAAWEGRLVLWGETSTGPVETPRREPTHATTAAATLVPARFTLAEARLVESAREIPGFVPSPAQMRDWVGWLPTNQHGALPSSPLLTEAQEDRGEVRLAPWTVPGLALSIEDAVTVLLACGGRPTLGPGVIVGPTLAYWANVLRFAGALVARQQYLPGLNQTRVGEESAATKSKSKAKSKARAEASEFRASWEPVPTGPLRIQVERLARSMPHACRALSETAVEPRSAASAVLAAVLAGFVDHLVRTSAAPAPRSARRFVSVHDEWIQALRTPDGGMSGDLQELTQLGGQVRQWRRPIEAAASAPFRLCFRLEEPQQLARKGTPADRWRVVYFLQALDDLSLLIPAERAWNPKKRETSILGRDGFQPREYLLAALGQAAALCPRIEASLRSAEPAGYELDAAGAHDFLAEKAGVLEEAGFGVFLPAWWTRKGTKLRLSARATIAAPKLKGKRLLSLDEIVQFRWEVALGDERLTLKELTALAALKAPLVQVRGQWVELSPEEIQAALEFWKTKGKRAISAREAVQTALGRVEPPGGLEFAGVDATGWIGDLLAQLEQGAGFEPLETPPGFQGTLRPYQTRGFSWLGFLQRWGLGACLADDMGLGKTIQTLALLLRNWESTPALQRRPTLLICPTSVVGNWSKEAARFTPELPVLVHHGADRAKGAAFKKQAARHGLVLSSYALLHRDFNLLKQVAWSGLILDEAQNIKNPETKQAKAARGLEVGHRIALTGTPVENHVGDLWSLIEFLNPGWLGTQAEFKRTFHVPIQAGRDPEASQRLQRLTGPFILRRLKTDKSIIADLPDKLEMKVFSTLTKEQATLYAAVVEETNRRIDSVDRSERSGLVLSTLLRLKQVCNHPAQYLSDGSAVAGRSGKLERLTEMLDEALAAGDRALIFTQFFEMGTLLKQHLQDAFGREVLFLHGATPKAQRDKMVERFQAKEAAAPPLFILSLKAGGTGLNLTAANHVFHFDRWWNPAVENQATDRAFRIGQTRRVQVHKFVCLGTLEEKIDAMIEEKQAVAGSVVGTGESWIAKLSNEELKDVFKLRSEALAD